MDQTQICPRFEKGIQIASKRWACLIIYQLLDGPKRFCAMESALSISGRLLSERLKELESEGIVAREVYPETPVRIEYSLTEKGRAFESVLHAIQHWSQTWLEPDHK